MNGQAVAGLVSIDKPEFAGMSEAWMSGLAVDDVDARVKKAPAFGVKPMKPIFDVPGVGRIAIPTEPDGAGAGWNTPMGRVQSRSVVMNIESHKVVSRNEWLAARKAHLAAEKEFTRARDELARRRRELPWVKVEKDYLFDGPNGRETLAELFHGCSQLMIYHFMFGPGWEQGCPSCSYLADHFDGATVHLAHRDVTFLVVSRAPLAQIAAFKKRMDWRFKWASSFGNDFNRDYHVSFTKGELEKKQAYYNYEVGTFPSEEAPGLSVFFKNDAGEVFHTYSAYARGIDILVGTYNMLDLVPKGRDEDHLAFTMAWVRHHDRYEDGAAVDRPAEYKQSKTASSCCD